MFDLEPSIAEWRRQLEANGITNPEVLDELEGHLRDEVERQMTFQVGAAEAFRVAIHRIGEAAMLKSEFENFAKARMARKRRDLWRAFGLSAVVIAPIVAALTCVLYPMALQASTSYAIWSGLGTNWRSDVLFGFFFRLVAGIGYCVAMPVCLFSLVTVGLLDWKKVANFRRHVLVFHLIIAVLLTTPEVVTQIMMFIPLQLLFEAAVLSARIWEWRTTKNG